MKLSKSLTKPATHMVGSMLVLVPTTAPGMQERIMHASTALNDASKRCSPLGTARPPDPAITRLRLFLGAQALKGCQKNLVVMLHVSL